MKQDPKWITRQDDSSLTPLHIAATYGHVEAVKWLLDNGADVNAVAYNGFAPLHLTEHPEVTELILDKKPDLRIQCGIQGQTALQRAVANLVDDRKVDEKQKWKRIVDLYLDAGADYDILVAIHLDDLDRVKAILGQAPKLADDFQDSSPLRTAASLGRLEICRYLVEKHRVDVDDFERGVGYPILKGALAHPDVVRLLIENGADLKTRITWRGGRTGMWIIGDDATLLHHAANDGVPKTINLLIDNGVDIFATAHDMIDASDKQMALEVAAFFGKADNAIAIMNHPQFAQAVASRRQELLDKCLLIGAVPSWLAREADRSRLIEALLLNGADPNTNRDEVTTLQLATEQIHPTHKDENQEIQKAVAVLREHGATVDLFSAVAIEDEKQVARLLKQDPQSANSRSPEGYPALHFAVGMNNEKIVKMLLETGGVDIRNQSDSTGYLDATALHCAAFWGRPEIAKLLIDAGADVDALTQRRSTPLHSAARMTNLKVAWLLLVNGAKIDARDADGKTPLDWADQVAEIKRLFREYRERTNDKSN
jgi:ankyrin repeat protein